MISETGIWSAEEAIPQNYPHSKKLAIGLALIFQRSECIVDFGCGDAFYLKYLQSQGFIKLFGIEGYPKEDDAPLFFECADLSEHYEGFLRGQVLCLEVGEHIPLEYEQTFIDNICRHCTSRLVLSWAVVGQGGIGHVNCRNNDYVISEIERRGFRLNQDLTDFLRADIEMDVRYFSDTVMVFDQIKLCK